MVAIRGAITVEQNTKDEILTATRELLESMIRENQVMIKNIISITFTATDDLDAVYPAVAARDLDITCAGLLCMQELNVNGSLNKCIRILMHVSSNSHQMDVKHIYLKEAIHLRPDLTK